MKRLTEQTGMATAWWILLLTKLPRYKFLIRKLWWVLGLTTAGGLAIAAWRTSKEPVVFVSSGRIMVSGKISIPEGATYSEEQTYFSGTQMELMRSAEVRKRALARVSSLHPELPAAPVSLDVAQLRGTAIFVLTAIGGNPDYTREFLDAVMAEYINTRKEMRSEKSDSTLTALTDELGRLEKEIRSSEDEMLAFQKTNNIGFLQEGGNSAGVYLAGLNRQLADLKTEYQLLNLLNLDQTLDRNQKKGTPPDSKNPGSDNNGAIMEGNGPGTDYLQAKQEIEVLKIKRDDLAKVLRPKHPDMIQLDQEIAHQESLIETFRTRTLEQLKSRKESISLQIKNLEGMVKEWDVKALDLSQRLAEYNNIKAKSERAKGVRERLLANLRSLDVNKNLDQDVVSILDPATPANAIRMGLVRAILMGCGIGLLLGIGILFVCDQIDDRISSFPEFQSYFSEPALAQIPKEKPEGNGLFPLQHNDLRHAFVESFRALRSSIYYLPVEGVPPKVFLITSGVPNEGKSTVATNLAITLSFAGAKTLLIDADLRRGQLQEKFGLKCNTGLTQILRSEAELKDVIRPTGLDNLWLLPRGDIMEHPGEKFLSKITDDLLKSIYKDYDYIVIDSAPVLVADDTTSLAPKVDAVIFVIRFSYSSARNCNEGLDCLRKRGANIIGLVCNDVDIESHNRYYSYYYSKYTDYYATAGKQEA